jgi:hypothetical protein
VGWIASIARGRFRGLVRRALALTPRGFIRNDVLRLTRLSTRLRLEWRSRDIHPWDRTLPTGRQRALLEDQLLHDADAAIERLFAMLPDAEAIEVRVLEPEPPDRVALSGTVTREDAAATRSLPSVRMRLQMMGLRLRFLD